MSTYIAYETAKTERKDILSDEFSSPTGEWNNFTTKDLAQLGQIQAQKHTDIRSFYPAKTIRNYLVFLNQSTVSSLDGQAINNIGQSFTLIPSENWDSGQIGVQTDRNNWYGISLTCSTGTTTTATSLTPNSPVDLSSYNNSDYDQHYITLAFPAFESSSIDLSKSYVEFTSTDFTNPSSYDSIALNNANVTRKSNALRDTEIQIPLKLLTNSNLSNICGVRFKIYNNGASSIVFRCLSIRCVANNKNNTGWKYAPLDINTQLKSVVFSPSPNGEINPDFLAASWPENSNTSNLPTIWPALYKSYTGSLADPDIPKPINGEFQVTFNSGSVTNASSANQSNEIALYLRDDARAAQQTDIDGISQEKLGSVNSFSDLLQLYGRYLQKDYSINPGKALYKTTLINSITATDGDPPLHYTSINSSFTSNGNTNVGYGGTTNLTVDGYSIFTASAGGLVLSNGAIRRSTSATGGQIEWEYAKIAPNYADVTTTVKGSYSTTSGTTQWQLGTIFWASDTNNWYKACVSSGYIMIQRVSSGTYTTVASASPSISLTEGAGVWFRTVTSGNTVTASVWSTDPANGGTPIATITYTGGTSVTGKNGFMYRLTSNPATVPQIYGCTIDAIIPNTSQTITLNDASFAPTSGAILIDKEEIFYSAKNDNVLTVSSRGANATAAASHTAGASVILHEILPSTPPKLTADITSTDATIPVESTYRFPDSGVILIGSEYIQYTSKTTNTFIVGSGGTRGYWSTTPAIHSASSRVNFYTQVNRHGRYLYPVTNGVTQSAMQTTGTNQFNLMFYEDTEQSSYVKLAIQWYKFGGQNQAKLLISDETGIENHSFNLPAGLLESNKDYAFLASIEENYVRLRLCQLYNTSISDPNHLTPIYDTGLIKSSFVKRRKGRFGWSADLLDGDVSIQSILSRGTTYGEMISSNKLSYTPVRGVQAFVDGTNYSEAVSSIVSSPFNKTNSSVTIDYKKNGSGSCREIINAAGIWQGLATNEFVINDFKDIDITFKVFTTGSDQKISAILYNKTQNIMVPIKVPNFDSNQWQNIRLVIDGENHPSGTYSLILAEESAIDGSTWWIDNLSIKRNEMLWYGRSYVNGINEVGADNWFAMGDTINQTNNGTVFRTSGKELQIKGIARTQFVNIYETKFVPKYATLGNFVKDRK